MNKFQSKEGSDNPVKGANNEVEGSAAAAAETAVSNVVTNKATEVKKPPEKWFVYIKDWDCIMTNPKSGERFVDL